MGSRVAAWATLASTCRPILSGQIIWIQILHLISLVGQSDANLQGVSSCFGTIKLSTRGMAITAPRCLQRSRRSFPEWSWRRGNRHQLPPPQLSMASSNPTTPGRNPGRKYCKPKHQSTIISDLDWYMSNLDTHKHGLILKEISFNS